MGIGQPWPQILEALRFDGTADEFMQALSARAEAAGQRALLLIDGINENNGPATWPDHLAGFLTMVRRYPWIGLVLIVRTTGRDLIVPSHINDQELLPIHHAGFANAPLEAITEFFEYYGLPLPLAPFVVYQELANPLLLRLYCQTATRQPGLLAQPLPGLTGMVNAALADIDERARRKLQSDPYQPIARPVCEALAVAMRESRDTYLQRSEATAIANAVLPGFDRNGYRNTPLAILIGENILAEDFVVDGAGSRPVPVIRFAFERIGDHLGSEALIRECTDEAPDANAVLRSVSAALALVAGQEEDIGGAYRLFAMLEALAVVLPEQLGHELPDLVTSLLPVGSLRHTIGVITVATWLRSLVLRDLRRFGEVPRKMLAELVVGEQEAAAYPLNDDRREAIRVALSLSVHPDQPLGTQWLHRLLAPIPAADRDRRWTAQIRSAMYPDTPFSTLLKWCRAAPHELLASASAGAGAPSFARLAAIPLMWALPSSDRFLRDRATRALVRLVDHDPAVISDLIEAVVSIDDDYVLERVLAVACASQLRQSTDVPALASQLSKLLGLRGLPEHVLARDYLVVTLEAMASSASHDTSVAKLAADVSPPYPASWPGPLGLSNFVALKDQHPPFAVDSESDAPSADSAEQEGQRRRRVAGGYVMVTSSIDRHGDFNTYTMHVPNAHMFPFARQRVSDEIDSSGLDDFNTELLPGWVFARVLDLGWSPARFGAVDVDISSEDQGLDPHKRERMGEKYQWLAWHEALARISGTYLLRDLDDEQLTIPYEGAWQLPFVRDFDPTHLCDLPAATKRGEWHAAWRSRLTLDTTVAASNDDGPVAVEIFDLEPEETNPWWMPVPLLPQPELSLGRSCSGPV